MYFPRPLALALSAALGCIDAFVALPIGPLNAAVALPIQAVPTALVAPDGALRRVACSDASPCPQASSAEVTVRCVDAVCALAPFVVRAVTPDVDLTSYETYRDYANALQQVTVEAAAVQVLGAGTANAVGPLDVWWTGLVGGAATSEHHLGIAPRGTVATGALTLPVTMDPAGVQALVAHILAGNTRLRLRLEGPLDVGAGALPAARLDLAVTLLLHVHGSL